MTTPKMKVPAASSRLASVALELVRLRSAYLKTPELSVIERVYKLLQMIAPFVAWIVVVVLAALIGAQAVQEWLRKTTDDGSRESMTLSGTKSSGATRGASDYEDWLLEDCNFLGLQ